MIKIKKAYLAEAKQDSSEQEQVTDTPNEAVTIDPDASVSEIATDIQDNAEAMSNGTATVSAQDAVKTATEIKQTAQEINAGAVAGAGVTPTKTWQGRNLNILDEMQNKLTDVLDEALRANKKTQRTGGTDYQNVLISGLPGSSKTASVYNWAAMRGINIHYLDSKNKDLHAYINGFTVRNAANPNLVSQAVSKNLAPLDRPNSVLLLDEYNRQTNSQVRASLLTLINEHEIEGQDENGEPSKHYFKNLLFTIAIINPAHSKDLGAAELNDAERSRFILNITWDSTPEEALRYFRSAIRQEFKRINTAIQSTNSNDEDNLNDAIAALHIIDLAENILTDSSFYFDGREDDTLYALASQQRNPLNQRTLTEVLDGSDGDIERLFSRIKLANFLDETSQMLLDIVDAYAQPSLSTLAKQYASIIPPAVKQLLANQIAKEDANKQASADTEADSSEENLTDIDSGLFMQGADTTLGQADPSAFNSLLAKITGI